MASCRNCETPLADAFCPKCGQKNVDLERPLPELLGEVMRETFDVDGRAMRTLTTLFRHPGELSRQFLAGRRKLYSSPIRLYLVISLLFFVVAAWVAGQGILLVEGQSLQADALGQQQFVAEQVPRLMFVLLPVFALILKVAFRVRPYFHHLIHSLHLHSAAYVLLALILPLEQRASESLPAIVVQAGLSIYLIVYLLISIHRVYDVSWLVATAKGLGVFVVYVVLASGLLELASYLTMQPSAAVPFLTD